MTIKPGDLSSCGKLILKLLSRIIDLMVTALMEVIARPIRVPAAAPIT